MKKIISLLLIFGGAFGSSAKKSPNVLYIISDDQAWTDYGFMGHPQIKTPRLDKLAKESVLFERGYVPTALCRPSLVTLINGQYTHKHGVTGNDPSPKNYPPRDGENYNDKRAQLISYLDRFETLPNLLTEKGYLSHQSGKWWEGNHKHGGFTHGMTRGFPQPGGRHGDDGLKIGREGLRPIQEFVETAVAQDEPFFLWYAPFLPHTPHNPPQRLFDKYKSKTDSPHIARYYAMCEWFDETCGELLGMIDKAGVRDNTMVVYVTDNGWIQDPDKGKYAPRSKQTPYEGGIRTPIMFQMPGKLEASDRPELVSSIDIFPTILAAAGARIPEGLPGINLLSSMQEGSKIERSHILGEGFSHDIADIKNPQASLLYRWAIEGRWKLLLTYDGEVNRYQTTHPRTEKRPQLFDLLNDPFEKNNLAAQNPKVVRQLGGYIQSWYPADQRQAILSY